MSVVTLQLGQCGNQLGYALFDKLSTELMQFDALEKDIFFRNAREKHQPAIARAVVMNSIERAEKGGKWQYDVNNQICQQSGSGNNWAYGYTVHGTASAELVLERVRREVEHCDYFKGFHAIQSLAGGTGSGLGSFISDLLHDNFSHSYLLNSVIWPYQSGEVIVQNYNTLLTMACLSESSNGVLILQNDMADQICQKLLSIPKPSFDQMNQVLANHIASVLLPAQPLQRFGRSQCQLPAIFQELCCHPGYRLMDIKLIPQLSTRSRDFSTHQWSGIMKHLLQMQIANSNLDEGLNWDISLETSQRETINKSISNLLFLRGPDTASCPVNNFLDRKMYVNWNSNQFQVFSASKPFNHYDKTASLLSNSQSVVRPLEKMISKAHQMYAAKAYLHQYAAYDVDLEFFNSCFLRLDQIVLNYTTI
ncbi:tubulin/FtsZ family [Thraustotheca clavata]|uniref:Tubulin delta chain n=1 Tax=Thraustotheca clavata TaxID=74557 RepID=A0A1V9ZK30_9STRA|nr:tubulin/FtsZ family [Thraustotheca clavata]